PATGKPSSSRPILIRDAAIDPATWSLDGHTLWVAGDGVLSAWSLADGQRLWKQTLGGPSGRWQVRRCGDMVIAVPIQARTRHFRFRWLLGSLQWTTFRPPADSSGWLPVVICEARTGRLVQRLNFEAGLPSVEASVTHSGLTLAPRLRKTMPPVCSTPV